MATQWTLQEAERNLSAIIQAAEFGEPQFIYRDGQKQAVLLSPEIWNCIAAPPYLSFKDLLLAIPKGEPFIDEDSHEELSLRDVEL